MGKKNAGGGGKGGGKAGGKKDSKKDSAGGESSGGKKEKKSVNSVKVRHILCEKHSKVMEALEKIKAGK